MTPGKRLFDVGLAVVLCGALALPFLLLVVLLVAIQGRPVLYRSERMLSPGRSFHLWKLRTMEVCTAQEGATGGDAARRITPVGRLLRRSRLDEIPQLWNILRGEMSFVGPRPPLRRYVEMYPALYARVLGSRPGLTGLATLRFRQSEERILAACTTAAETDAAYVRLCLRQKARLDMLYQHRQSVRLDLAVLGATLGGVFFGSMRSRS